MATSSQLESTKKPETLPPSHHRTATSERRAPAIARGFHDPASSRNFRGDGYQHLEEGEEAYETEEVEQEEIGDIGESETEQEDRVEHQVPDKEVNNPSRVTCICHAPILTGLSGATSRP